MLNDDLQDALAELRSLQSDFDGDPLTAWWSGQDLPCVAGGDKHGKTLGVAGLALDSDLTLVIDRDDFADPANLPQPKQSLNYPGQAGRKYRIDTVENSPGTAFVVLHLIDATKGV